jgi:hypothetical protein
MSNTTTTAVFLFQSGTFDLLVLAVRRRNAAVAVNALGAFALALLPVVAGIGLRATLTRPVSVGPILSVWLAAAGFLHSLGMSRLYESTWWWDHLTHIVSAALVAALLYAGVGVTLPDTAGIDDSSGVVAAVTVVFSLAVGLFWELIELAAREVGE